VVLSVGIVRVIVAVLVVVVLVVTAVVMGVRWWSWMMVDHVDLGDPGGPNTAFGRVRRLPTVI